MVKFIRTVGAACLLMLAVAATAGAAQRRVAVGDAALLPRGASLRSAVNPHRPMRVTLSLTSRNPIAMHTLALAVATPGSPQYGQTLTVSQFARRFGAPRSTLATVRRALERAGLHVLTTYANHLSITASGSAATIMRTFDTRLAHVRLAGGRRTMVNTTAPTLPAPIASKVDAVFGLDGLADPAPAGLSRRRRGSPADAVHTATHAHRRAARPDIVTGGPQPCVTATAAAQPLPPTESSVPYFGYTADGLAATYGLPALYAQGDAGQGQTILLFEQESLDPADVAAFQACYGTSTRVSIVPVDTPDPVDSGISGDGEAALDVDQIIGMAPQASVVVYEASQHDNDANGELLSAIASNHTGKIVSISYGTCEAYAGASSARAEAKLFDEMAIQGQSVFASSGDTGAQGCAGDETLGVSDPASQPTVTGVGATSLYSGTSQSPVPYDGSNPLIEGIWNSTSVDSLGNVTQFATGGGDSMLWKMPSFQSSAAAGLGVVNSFSGTGNCGSRRCREVPDVSAAGDPSTGTVIYANTNDNGGAPGSQWQTFGGTSASAPLWAAFAALTNVLPTCRGLSVGDINPALYGLAGSNYAGYFRDVTAPSAFTSFTTNWTDLTTAPSGVFPVGAGYDLATGLGAPLMNTLAPALCATRAPVYTVTVGSPGNKRFYLHRTVKFHVPATDSGAAALSFHATGLPPGLKLDALTGVISGKVKKLGKYTVTVGAEDFATNQGTGQFTIAVVKKPAPKAHFGNATLHGIASRKAKLRFVVAAPRHRRLRSVTIHLSRKSGLSFKRSNRGIFVHTDTGTHHRRVRVKAKRHRGSLTLHFPKTQKKVIVVVGRQSLRTSRKLARRTRTHSFRVRIAISATDTKRHTSRHAARVKVTQAKRQHHKKQHHKKKHHHHM